MLRWQRIGVMTVSVSFVAGCGVLPGKTPPQRLEPPGSVPPDIGLKAIAPIEDVIAVTQAMQRPGAIDRTTFVTMEGRIIGQLDDELYAIADDTGQIRIDAPSGLLPSNTLIRITGRIEWESVDVVSWQPM